MKALVIPRFDVPEVLELRDVPDPLPGPGEELVKIEAAGVNFADIMTAQGGYPTAPPPPLIAGREFAGKVESTGTGVMGYTQMGAFAERLAARSDLLWPQPVKWSMQEAAAFPVNYFTAYLAYWKAGLVNKPSTDEPARVLIHAVAGGLGTAAVQIGKILGVDVRDLILG
jgi:NADPH2:quinone reductase